MPRWLLFSLRRYGLGPGGEADVDMPTVRIEDTTAYIVFRTDIVIFICLSVSPSILTVIVQSPCMNNVHYSVNIFSIFTLTSCRFMLGIIENALRLQNKVIRSEIYPVSCIEQ
jgi:hypothetical protein